MQYYTGERRTEGERERETKRERAAPTSDCKFSKQNAARGKQLLDLQGTLFSTDESAWLFANSALLSKTLCSQFFPILIGIMRENGL